MRLLPAILVLIATSAAADELGLRYWLSSGNTKWSHNAQSQVPAFGNPTSILDYSDLVAHSVELHGRKNIGASWFVRGTLGVGWIQDGELDDEDYLAGQVKFSDTTSSVDGKRLSYASFDIGRDLWTLNRGRSKVGFFVGYHYWTERQDAYGVTSTVPATGVVFDGAVPAISNEVTWDSLRIGLAMSTVLGARTRLTFDAAWIPYAKLKAEDSHYHRADLGPVPNIHFRGRGQGLTFDFELRQQFAGQWEFGLGARFWWIETTHGTVRFGDADTPLIRLETERVGFTASLTRRW